MTDPISRFYEDYPDFKYTYSRNDGWRQKRAFHALAAKQEWSREDRAIAFRRYQEAWAAVMDQEFSGTGLADYQTLCRQLEITPIPDSINGCKQQLRGVNVNIIDLVQYRRDERANRYAEKPFMFENEEDLKRYSDEEDKICPLEGARSGMLRALLKKFD